MRQYRGVTIERTDNGQWWVAMVPDPTDTVWQSYRTVKADTLTGIRECIREVLDSRR